MAVRALNYSQHHTPYVNYAPKYSDQHPWSAATLYFDVDFCDGCLCKRSGAHYFISASISVTDIYANILASIIVVKCLNQVVGLSLCKALRVTAETKGSAVGDIDAYIYPI